MAWDVPPTLNPLQFQSTKGVFLLLYFLQIQILLSQGINRSPEFLYTGRKYKYKLLVSEPSINLLTIYRKLFYTKEWLARKLDYLSLPENQPLKMTIGQNCSYISIHFLNMLAQREMKMTIGQNCPVSGATCVGLPTSQLYKILHRVITLETEV